MTNLRSLKNRVSVFATHGWNDSTVRERTSEVRQQTQAGGVLTDLPTAGTRGMVDYMAFDGQDVKYRIGCALN